MIIVVVGIIIIIIIFVFVRFTSLFVIVINLFSLLLFSTAWGVLCGCEVVYVVDLSLCAREYLCV